MYNALSDSDKAVMILEEFIVAISEEAAIEFRTKISQRTSSVYVYKFAVA